ncbi:MULTISPECIES: peptidylprolyl isomerase [unclassified Leeuwenhoekiella]|uniref:FKBP-type peptidyl-prolyl cis-trans isomerase n=1 Tax=unclassified Leeuwenhoekiella TaxID=2615029 RepID=UPI000C3BA0D7|nr:MULTISPECIES: peptidylprolyl isomerase [unclassified Leeuwenhoekiella]MAW95036.1 peptidylprolyl isomerase [Leeuwenhoekiella sp.]MBA79756.1 peptidylprolyl isomerase [Leeuwenhoekiella sp.]|tara:strand:+ start:12792 stop:13244 length:453 start_codon:yes stop_codon:yes gene_type:complete
METQEKNTQRKVKNNDTVKVHYTGKLTNGQIFDSSVDKQPLEFQLGQGMIIPGFEQGLIDMSVSEKKTVTIPEAEAYGEVRKELFQEVPKSDLPSEIDPQVGMGLMAKNPDGTERQLRVAEVRNDSIVIDANHPLAGQDLVFDLELVEIK